MNEKERRIFQNRRYISELAISLNKHLKGITKKEFHDVNDVDTIVRNLIEPQYWDRFGVEQIDTDDSYHYLDGLSKSAYFFIVNRVKHGRANIYHSIESYLGAQKTLHRLQSLPYEQQNYFSKNKVKHDLKEADKPIINEIVEYIYNKL